MNGVKMTELEKGRQGADGSAGKQQQPRDSMLRVHRVADRARRVEEACAGNATAEEKVVHPPTLRRAFRLRCWSLVSLCSDSGVG